MTQPVFWRWLPLVWVPVAALLVSPVTFSQTTGECYIAEVPGPIALPDETVEQAGQLKICLSRMYSPVAGFHRTSVDGRVTGLYVSRKLTETDAEEDPRAVFAFALHADGTYELESYSCSNGGRRITFDLRREQVESRWRVQPSRARGDETSAPTPMRVTLLASPLGSR